MFDRQMRYLMVITAIVILPAHTRAQESSDIHPGASFSEERWAVSLMASGAVDVTNRDVAMLGPAIGLTYDLTESFTAVVELGGLHVWQDDDTNAIAGNLLLRQYLFEAGSTRVFAEFGGGVFRAGERVPEEGTHFNTTIQVGIGLLYPIADDIAFVGGIRYYHLSNARRRGGDRNPSLNGPALFVGVQFRF